jgi:hypothetical protein
MLLLGNKNGIRDIWKIDDESFDFSILDFWHSAKKNNKISIFLDNSQQSFILVAYRDMRSHVSYLSMYALLASSLRYRVTSYTAAISGHESSGFR